MKTHVAYCSARDQQVRVVYKEEMPEDVRPSPHDDVGVVCLAHGEECTGDMCPLFDVPTEKMRKWLEEHREEGESAFVIRP
ncbi:MAG: hypothetical protein Q8W44_08440 [Candidatus Palauibacterales bacterium]|nr:hypothetical protein [Candidatus Palauibacterales bacterium]